jgi:hypothetical protein
VDGNPHPGYLRWTVVTFKHSPFTYGRAFTSQARFNCPCNGVVHATVDDCIENCKVTLACFVGICEAVGRTCIATTDTVVRFYADIGVTAAKWSPRGGRDVCRLLAGNDAMGARHPKA